MIAKRILLNVTKVNSKYCIFISKGFEILRENFFLIYCRLITEKAMKTFDNKKSENC